MSQFEGREADFVVVKEDYSRFLCKDGTIIKAKIVVKKIFFHPQKTPEGYPMSVALDAINVAVAVVPESLKRTPSKELYNPLTDKGKEISFDEQQVHIQEYITPDGFRVTVKPVVTKIMKYDKYNVYGEPIYNVNIQAITNIEKMASTA
jgi:hypothetical protein